MLDKEILDKVNNYIKNGYPSVLKTGYDDIDSMLSNIDKGSL